MRKLTRIFFIAYDFLISFFKVSKIPKTFGLKFWYLEKFFPDFSVVVCHSWTLWPEKIPNGPTNQLHDDFSVAFKL